MNREGALRVLALSLLAAVAVGAARGQAVTPAPVAGDAQAVLPDGAPPADPPEIKFNLPEVKCSNGQLTIHANSSNIRSVLQALRTCLGIPIEVPATLVDEPLFVELGPGPVNSILSDFLGLTDLNFVVVSSQSVPSTVLKIELSPTNSEAEPNATSAIQATEQMSPARRAWLAARNAGRGVPPQEFEAASADASVAGHSEGLSVVQEATGTVAPSAPTANAAGAGSVEVAAAAPVAPDATQATPADNGLQTQITDMQRLFEERKKLNQKPTDPKAGAAAPGVGADGDATPPSQ